MNKRKTAWDVDRGLIDRGYGHLPYEMLDDWARYQIKLSRQYVNPDLCLVEPVDPKILSCRHLKMMERVSEALVTRSNFSQEEIESRLATVDKHLDDPGLLENFEYFDIPSSDFMLQFYFAVWDGRIAEAMDFLHNYGKDLKGIPQMIPENDIWYQMSYFEGMNIDKRKQARSVVEFMKFHHISRATSFGGGNIPERLYGLPKDLYLSVFDNGPVSRLEDLFPDATQRAQVNYIRELLSSAPAHQELLGTQELVWMHGVSMYLNEANFEMTGAILCAAALLQSGGYMCYDYLIWNDSMRRVVETQCWPNDPSRPMTVFEHPEDAIRQGRRTIENVNYKLAGKAFMDIVDVNVHIIEPWGVTGVYLTLQKYS